MSQMAAPLLLLLLAMASLVGGVSILPSGYTLANTLVAGQYLHNSLYFLAMKPDCNVVIYSGTPGTQGPAVWNTTTGGDGPNCSLWMQADGNLVVYNATNIAKWSSHTWDAKRYKIGAYYLKLQNNGTISIYDIANSEWANDTVIWDSVYGSTNPLPDRPSAVSILTSGNTLNSSATNDYLQYGSNYFLAMQTDCNLVTYQGELTGGKMLWESNTKGKGVDCELSMGKDGNLVIYSGSNSQIWASDTAGPLGAFYLRLQSDGNLSIFDIESSSEIWNSHLSPFQVPSPGPLAPSPTPPTRTPAYMPVPSAPPKKSRLWIIGVVGGVLLFCVISGLLIYFGWPCVIDPAEKELRLRLENNGGKSHAWSLAKIKHATKNFERKVGQGGFGEVFYGKLADGQEVAVKVLSATSHQNKQEFFNEIDLLSVVHHKNLVSLVGYCYAWKQQILIYEYMSGGDLRRRLQSEMNAPTNPLSWKERTNIIMQVAEGIEYLHDKCSPTIIHRDVKSSNILLTEHLDAKVADFGLSKLRAVNHEGATHITTAVKGTPGYLDPEYYETGKLTERSDVYAFGVVLMEILTAQNQISIIHMVSEAWKSNQLEGLADPQLMGLQDRRQFSEIVKLSLWCTRKRSSDRPSMPQVVQRLREIGLAQSSKPGMMYAFESEILHKEDMDSDPIIMATSESSSSRCSVAGRLSSEIPSSR